MTAVSISTAFCVSMVCSRSLLPGDFNWEVVNSQPQASSMGVRLILDRRGGAERRNTVPAVGCRLLVSLAALVLGTFVALAGEAGRPKPATPEPAAPRVQERDLKSLSEEKTVKEWKPGDPVRVTDDLREDGKTDPDKDAAQSGDGAPPEPIVREPVAPQVMEGNVDDLPKAKTYKEGDPVRVAPDLRESVPKD